MPRVIKPIEDDELAGLVMAVTAEAGKVGWSVRYGIQGDGSLVLHMSHPAKMFKLVTAGDGRSGRLVIEAVTAES
jgi:hypothetical protein